MTLRISCGNTKNTPHPRSGYHNFFTIHYYLLPSKNRLVILVEREEVISKIDTLLSKDVDFCVIPTL